MMVEYSDIEERKAALARLIGVERKTWLQVDGFDKVYPIVNEDLDRETEEKTSSVHFARFEFTPEMIGAMKSGTALRAGVEHPEYHYEIDVDDAVRDCLAADFD
jgi:hypothetical protein